MNCLALLRNHLSNIAHHWGRALFLALFLLSSLLGGCATTAYTGRTQLSLMSHEEELQITRSAAKEVADKQKIAVRDFRIAIIDDMGKRMAAAIDPAVETYEWSFHIIRNDTVNAFTTGDGSIFFYMGMFDWAENSAQVAAVMGHEMGHVIARHMGERYSQRALSGVLGLVGMLAVGASTGSADAMEGFLDLYQSASEVLALKPFNRTQEYEADYIGLLIMADAGYDPNQAVELWRNSLSQTPQSLTDLLSTHPLDEKRIAELEKHMPEAMARYEAAQAAGKTPDGTIKMKREPKTEKT